MRLRLTNYCGRESSSMSLVASVHTGFIGGNEADLMTFLVDTLRIMAITAGHASTWDMNR